MSKLETPTDDNDQAMKLITGSDVGDKRGLDIVVKKIPTISTATITSIPASTSSTTLKTANADRKGLLLYNDSNSDCFIKFGATASISSFSIKLKSQGHFFIDGPIYSGVVDGIWTTDNGAMRVTEL